MNPRLRERLKTKGMLAPADISRAGLLPEMAQDVATPSEPAEWDAYAPTSAPPMVEAQRAPLSPPDTAPAAQSAADSKPPTDKERLRAFLLQRVTGVADAPAPESDAERSAKFSDAVAPGLNRISAGMWARLGERAPSQLPTNTAAPYQADREKMNDYLRAQMATKTGVAQQLYGDMTAEDTAAATQAQAKVRQDATEKDKADELARQKERDAQQKVRDEEMARHNRATEGTAGQNADTAKALADAKAKKGTGGAPAQPDEVQFGSDVYKYDGPPVSKELKLEGAKKVREKSAQWGQVVTGLESLETALARFVADPSPENKGLLYGPALTAAGSTNAAIGQGAMSQEEKAAQFQALGITLDAGGVEAAIKRAFGDKTAAAEVLSRVRQMKGLAKASVDSAARAYHYSSSAAKAPGAAPASGMVTVIDAETGQPLQVTSAEAKTLIDAKMARTK